MTLLRIEIDLAGNARLGPSYKSVSVDVESWAHPTDLRIMAAEFYGVPLAQVGYPAPVTEGRSV